MKTQRYKQNLKKYSQIQEFFSIQYFLMIQSRVRDKENQRVIPK